MPAVVRRGTAPGEKTMPWRKGGSASAQTTWPSTTSEASTPSQARRSTTWLPRARRVGATRRQPRGPRSSVWPSHAAPSTEMRAAQRIGSRSDLRGFMMKSAKGPSVDAATE